jgi:hypothetical protein
LYRWTWLDLHDLEDSQASSVPTPSEVTILCVPVFVGNNGMLREAKSLNAENF